MNRRPIIHMNAEFTQLKPVALCRNTLSEAGDLETLAQAKKPATVKRAINQAWNA